MLKPTGLSNHPIFRTNSMTLLSDEGILGVYNFLLDALLTDFDNKSVVHHEVAHRVLTYYSMDAGIFDLLRTLAGISHGLLWAISYQAVQQDIQIQGNTLGQLKVSGRGPSDQSTVSKLEQFLERSVYVEELFDVAWRGWAPIAELAAIDFAEGVDLFRGGTWRLISLGEPTTKEQKKKYFEDAISAYPAEFGGYYVKYGSFQDLMRKVWSAYDAIENVRARKELLRLCMNSLSISDDFQVTILDSIEIFLENAPLAQQNGEKASEDFFAQRQKIGEQYSRFGQALKNHMFADIPKEQIDIHGYIGLVKILVDAQITDELEGGLFGGFSRIGMPVVGLGPSWAFFNFRRRENGERVFEINPQFLSLLIKIWDKSDNPWSTEMHQNWWRILLFLEALRESLKTGLPLHCPLRDWHTVDRGWTKERGVNVKCSDDCFIRKLLLGTGWWWKSLLPSESSVCEI